MPELPEVETIKRSLAPLVVGCRIAGVEVNLEKIVAWPPDVEDFKAGLTGSTFTGLGRRGKFLVFELNSAERLAVHLRMSGRLVVCDPGERVAKHTHVRFFLHGERELRFVNPRQFGRMYLIAPGEAEKAGLLAELGPDPLDSDFGTQDFQELFAGRTARVKSLLLNQRFLAGLGNIYIDEALYLSGIHPARSADSLSEVELEQLYQRICQVLREGIRHRGTTRSDYVDASGAAGRYQECLRVYGREGECCPRCGAAIERIKVSGRSSHICPCCQRGEAG